MNECTKKTGSDPVDHHHHRRHRHRHHHRHLHHQQLTRKEDEKSSRLSTKRSRPKRSLATETIPTNPKKILRTAVLMEGRTYPIEESNRTSGSFYGCYQ